MSLIEQIKTALDDEKECINFITKLNSEPKLLFQRVDQESLIDGQTLLKMLRNSSLNKDMLHGFCRALRANIQSIRDYRRNDRLININKLITNFTKHSRGVNKSVAPMVITEIGYSKKFLKICKKLLYTPKLCNIHDKLQ
ncbi:MAG: hypothetical protein Q8M40_02940, partial [Legionella sp.]|nr:hypothetical protein [Legionella sp.]